MRCPDAFCAACGVVCLGKHQCTEVSCRAYVHLLGRMEWGAAEQAHIHVVSDQDALRRLIARHSELRHGGRPVRMRWVRPARAKVVDDGEEL